MKERLAPFLMLLEARYAPLLFAVAPQAYAVYLWLFPHPYDGTGELFAVMGGIGYEFIYVGAIAWAEEGRWSLWTWGTAVIALLFSMAVAYYVYRSQGGWAWLHAGFPLVAFGYTMNMHAPARAVKVKTGDSTVLAPIISIDRPSLSKRQQVTALAERHGLSESTIWRRVKQGLITLEEGA
jgi:hypothetical protein